jgi:hypothetical protein
MQQLVPDSKGFQPKAGFIKAQGNALGYLIPPLGAESPEGAI